MTSAPPPGATTTSRVWPGSAEVADGVLAAVGGVAVEDLAERWGTPLYVLDTAEVEARARRYTAALGPDVDVYYASKALCVTQVLRLVRDAGLGVDVASAGELATALAAGVPGERILLHGNNKSTAELRMALDAGVGRIVVDSLDEVERLRAIGRPATVLLRLTPGILSSTHAYVATASDDQKFGLSIARGLASQAVGRIATVPHLRLAGLHVHMGSNITSGEDFARGIATIAGFATAVGMDLAELNLGGGLGIAYTPEDEAPTIESHVATLLEAVDRALPTRPRLAVEPGRSLVGPAGITLYRVGTVKHVPEVSSFAAVDGGLSDNLRPALYGARYTVAATRPGNAQVPYVLAGKHCESGDVLARDVLLPADLRVGDLVATAATGAYGYAMASNYNRIPRPAMVEVRDGRSRLLVRRETIADLLVTDVVDGDWA